MPYGHPLYGIFWGHIFGKCGGGGGQMFLSMELQARSHLAGASKRVMCYSISVSGTS